jgi:copper transport protein
LIVKSAILGAVTLVAAMPFRIARVGGGLDALNNNDVISAELRGPIGQAVAVTAVALLAFAVFVERRAPAWLAGVAALAGLAGFSLEGHTRAMHLRWAMISSDVVHLSAGAVWLGGIVGLTVAFRSTVGAVPLAVLVRRFSNTALVAVAAVSVSGVIMAWIVLPKAGELTSTGYGLALILKVSLVAVVVGLGAFNRWMLVPTVSTAIDPEAPDEPREDSTQPEHDVAARRHLSRIVLGELALLLIVVGVTAVLVTRSPVSSASGTPSASAAAPLAPTTTVPPQVVTIELSGGAGTAEVSITPSRIGSNTVSVVLRDVEGRVINPYEAPTVEFSQAASDVNQLRPEVRPVYIGQYELTADLGIAGDWDVTVRVRVSDFASETGSGMFTIS